LITGPGAATVTLLGPRTIRARIGRPGRYLLRVQFTPYWSIPRGSACVSEASSHLTELTVRKSGVLELSAIEAPTRVLVAAFDDDATVCHGHV
jgi:hypothetical protein